MVRTYKRKRNRASYSDDDLRYALKAIADGASINRTSTLYKISVRTLRRHRDEKVKKPGSTMFGAFKKTFS